MSSMGSLCPMRSPDKTSVVHTTITAISIESPENGGIEQGITKDPLAILGSADIIPNT